VEMRAYIARLHQRLETTTLYVTHDQTEAMTMADRVAVLRDGQIEQVDVPQMIYTRPANMFVAGFIGSPAMNFVHTRLEPVDGSLDAVFGRHRLRLPDRPRRRTAMGRYAGHDVVLGLRPEVFSDARGGHAPPASTLEIDVSLAEPLGAETIVHFDVAAELEDPAGALVEANGDRTHLRARLDGRSTIAAGDRVRLCVDLDRVHLFDPETEAAIA
jgi:multiple sugar transport system ATP-binding protein